MSDIILASNSPRRREMFGWLGLPFSCQTPDVDETPLVDESPMVYVSRLAVAKARAIARQFNLLDTIVGADTIVVHNGVLLGKPTNDADANRMLTQLRGKTHQVLTAVTICWETNKPMRYAYQMYECVNLATLSCKHT